MKKYYRIFSLPKFGNEVHENEDAYYIRNPCKPIGGYYRFSLADGATEAYLSKKWAEMLVQSFGESESLIDEDNFPDFINTVLDSFNAWKSRYPEEREADGKPLQWNEEARLREGSDATFLGSWYRKMKMNSGGYGRRSRQGIPAYSKCGMNLLYPFR